MKTEIKLVFKFFYLFILRVSFVRQNICDTVH